MIRKIFLLLVFNLILVSQVFCDNIINPNDSEKQVPWLIEQLKTAEGEKLNYIIRHLGAYKDKRAFEPLINVLENTNIHIAERTTAIDALSSLEDKRAVPYIIKYIDVNNEKMKLSAAGALVILGEKEIAYPVIVELLDKGVNALDYLVLRENGDVFVIRDKQAEDIILKALNNPKSRIKVRAMNILIDVSPSNIMQYGNKFIDISESILKKSDESAALDGAVYILQKIGNERAKNILKNVMGTTQNKRLQSKIRNALTKIDKKEIN